MSDRGQIGPMWAKFGRARKNKDGFEPQSVHIRSKSREFGAIWAERWPKSADIGQKRAKIDGIRTKLAKCGRIRLAGYKPNLAKFV